MLILNDWLRIRRFCWKDSTIYPSQLLRRSMRLKKWKLFSRTKTRLLRSWIRRLEISRRDLYSVFQREMFLIKCFLITSTRQTALYQLERLEMDFTILERRKFTLKFLMEILSSELAEDSWSLKSSSLLMLRQRWIKSIKWLMNSLLRCTPRVNPWPLGLIQTLNYLCIETLPQPENLDHQMLIYKCQKATQKSMGRLERVTHNFELKWDEIRGHKLSSM